MQLRMNRNYCVEQCDELRSCSGFLQATSDDEDIKHVAIASKDKITSQKFLTLIKKSIFDLVRIFLRVGTTSKQNTKAKSVFLFTCHTYFINNAFLENTKK